MKIKMFTMLVVSVLVLSSMSTSIVQAQTNPDPIEAINLIAPNTNPARNSWSLLMSNELAKIGFNVEYENVGWDILGPRTYSHPAPAGIIPTANSGGFDIFFVGLSGDPTYDPTGTYANTQFSPSGDNMAHYNNTQVTDLITSYTQSPTAELRAPFANQIQEIIYDELPYIPIMNSYGLWAYSQAIDADFALEDWLMISTTNVFDGWKDFTVTDGSLTYAHTYEITEFNTFVLEDYITAQYLSPVLQGLYQRDPTDPDYAYVPLLADSMPVWSANNTVANVTIRSGVTFSNGDTLDAYDVENTFRMHLTPGAASKSYATLTNFLRNSDGWNVNNSVVALDANTVQFRFEDPYFLATQLMSDPIYSIDVIGTPDAPADAGYNFNADPLTYTIGTGPFKLDASISDAATTGNVKVNANPTYFNGTPALNSIEFNYFGDKAAAISAVQGGTVDIIDAQAYVDKAEVENDAAFKFTIFPDYGTQMMVVNMDHPVFGTGLETPLGIRDKTKAAEAAKYVRKAIAHATPQQFIIDEIADGVGAEATSLWPSVAEGYNTDLSPYAYNITLAMEYMEMAGYDLGLETEDPVTVTDTLTETGGTVTIETTQVTTAPVEVETPVDLMSILIGLFSVSITAVVLRKRK